MKDKIPNNSMQSKSTVATACTKKASLKTIQKQRKRRQSPNDDISNERRQKLLDLILKSNSIRRAANELGINNSTAKSIFYKYKNTGQINKHPRCKKISNDDESESGSRDKPDSEMHD